MKCDKYMGMEVHQAMTVVAVLDGDGKVILETMVATEAAAITRLVKSISGPLRVTFEQTTQSWPCLHVSLSCKAHDPTRRDTDTRAQVRQPIPGENAFNGDDDILPGGLRL
jgi:hypothetical protein